MMRSSAMLRLIAWSPDSSQAGFISLLVIGKTHMVILCNILIFVFALVWRWLSDSRLSSVYCRIEPCTTPVFTINIYSKTWEHVDRLCQKNLSFYSKHFGGQDWCPRRRDIADSMASPSDFQCWYMHWSSLIRALNSQIPTNQICSRLHTTKKTH